jgi:hypothetical protein
VSRYFFTMHQDGSQTATQEAIPEKHVMDLKIAPVKTKKSLVKQRPLMENHTIPRHPSSVLFNGRSGSGKSVLIHNLLAKPQFYKDYFDLIYLFSGAPDDLFDDLDIPENRTFTDDSTWENKLSTILSKQKDTVKKRGIDKAPKVLILYEDIQNHQKFMRRSKWFLKTFIANRHYGVSTWITSQSFTKTPRACRINCNNLFIFRGTQGEIRLIIDEYCPDDLTKKEFQQLVAQANGTRYHFLHINNRCQASERFRHNLDSVLEWD